MIHSTSFISLGYLHLTLVLFLIFSLLFERLLQLLPPINYSCLSQSAQAAVSKYQRLDGFNLYFSQFYWQVQVQGAADSVSDESPLPGFQTVVLLLYPHVVEGKR